MSASAENLVFTKEFTKQEALPAEAIARANALMQSGRLHRYNNAPEEESDAALLEREFAAHLGARYCIALSSCGASLFVALKCAGVGPGDLVLSNAFTLAPVPGAIAHAGARPVFVECGADFGLDLEDLERQARASRARFFLMSHMRGHIADMDRTVRLCRELGMTLIEDCAHTMGARWDGRWSGTFGLIGCFSTQTYKHLNSGEGGLLITDDERVAAQAILYSGSYMFYDRHLCRPDAAIFEDYKYTVPNLSLRMTNLQAALLRPQLDRLAERVARWNERYGALEAGLKAIPGIRVPGRSEKEQFVGSSIQFALEGLSLAGAEAFVAECRRRGVSLMWFGWREPQGYTSRYGTWRYLDSLPTLPQTDRILDFMCDMRVPLTFSLEDCETIVRIIDHVRRTGTAGRRSP
jgi:dTDP-4-amino-4,6-dideoxygalactose transaminase